MLTVFVIISGENWNDVWSATEQAVGPGCAPFFILLVVVGNYVVLNLFVAILLGGFTAIAPDDDAGASGVASADVTAIETGTNDEDDKKLKFVHTARPDSPARIAAPGGDGEVDPYAKGGSSAPPPAQPLQAPTAGAVCTLATSSTLATVALGDSGPRSHSRSSDRSSRRGSTPTLTPAHSSSSGRTVAAAAPAPSCKAPRTNAICTTSDVPAADDPDDYALGLLGPRNPLRRAALGLINSSLPHTSVSFENLIILLITFSSACMALEDCALIPGSPKCVLTAVECATIAFVPSALDVAAFEHKLRRSDFLEAANLYATWIFFGEICLKIFAYGLLLTPNAYLKSGWHQLDALIVASSVAALLSDAAPGLRTLRVLRVLRPLGLIARFGNLRVIVNLFVRTLPSVGNVIMVVGLFLVVFGILGVQLFAGRLASCTSTDPFVARHQTQSNCVGLGGDWQNPEMGSFDNIESALLLLFESATMEGWPDVMWATIDAFSEPVCHPCENLLHSMHRLRVPVCPSVPSVAPKGHAPVRDFRLLNGTYVLLWVLIGGMFLINVFVGVIVETFADIKRQEDGLKLMDDDQQQWVETMQHLLKLQVDQSQKTCSLVHAPIVMRAVVSALLVFTCILVCRSQPMRWVPEPRGDPARVLAYQVVRHSTFEPAILSLILFNTALMAADGYGISPGFKEFIEQGNTVCTVVFCMEALIKIYALSATECVHTPRALMTLGNLIQRALLAPAAGTLRTLGTSSTVSSRWFRCWRS